MSTDARAKSAKEPKGLRFTESLTERLASAVILIGAKGDSAWLSREALQLLGFPAGEPRDLPIEDLPQPLATIARETQATPSAIASGQLDLTVPGKGILTLHLSVHPLPAARSLPGVVLVLHDLTSIRQFEDKVLQLDRLANLGTLSASMAHEIKNALVAGKTFIELLLEKNPDAELAGIVQREIGRIDSIVGRMLRFGGHRSRVLGVVHLHEILEHSLRLVQPQLEAKFIEVDTSFQAASDLIEGDEHELQQAFVNLLLNALEALPPNGSLKATTSLLEPSVSGSAARQLRLTIQDSGPGIPPENLDRLFEPFFTTKPEGTGLGLAITQRIVQEHRGEITVETKPKLGTTFIILLPAARPPVPGAKSAAPAKGKPAQATPRPAGHRRS